MTIYHIPIEPIDSRYTKQWYEYIPKQLEALGVEVVTVDGDEVPPTPNPGAFLDFAATNIFKSSQLVKIAELFRDGKVKDGDYFLYTDAWNPSVIQLRYMAELLGIKIKIGGLFHAGSWDRFDFLGRLIGDKLWIRNAESAMFHCYDHSFFATEFHLKMFLSELFDETDIDKWQEYYPGTLIVGWPMSYLTEILAPFANTEKKNKIIFPHRIAPEKQLEIFKDLATEMPEYEWFVAQEQPLTKDEYHQHLAESKIAFSASLQETLGIALFEAAVVGALPLVPNRLSYSEMWDENGRYPSEWTINWDQYQKHKQLLIGKIKHIMEDYSNLQVLVKKNADAVGNKFFNGDALYKVIIETQK